MPIDFKKIEEEVRKERNKNNPEYRFNEIIKERAKQRRFLCFHTPKKPDVVTQNGKIAFVGIRDEQFFAHSNDYRGFLELHDYRKKFPKASKIKFEACYGQFRRCPRKPDKVKEINKDNPKKRKVIDISSSIIYNVPENVPCRGTIIAFHAGCFSGGKVTYNKAQNSKLAKIGYEVHQVSFPKKYNDFMTWTKEFDFSQMTMPIFCLGRSSGGYLAKLFTQIHRKRILRSVYLCPVLNPKMRMELLPKFGKRTMEFFEKECNIKNLNTISNREQVFVPQNDENIPIKCYGQLRIYTISEIKTHAGMCEASSDRLIDNIREFF